MIVSREELGTICTAEDADLLYVFLYVLEKNSSYLPTEGLDSALREVLELLHATAPTGWEDPFFAGLRVESGILPEKNVSWLQRFMRPQDSIRVKQAALQAVQTVFSMRPPELEVDKDFSNHIYRLAMNSLSRKLVTSSPANAALSGNAVCALAAIGDDRLPQVVRHLKSLTHKPLAVFTEGKLRLLRTRWQDNMPVF